MSQILAHDFVLWGEATRGDRLAALALADRAEEDGDEPAAESIRELLLLADAWAAMPRVVGRDGGPAHPTLTLHSDGSWIFDPDAADIEAPVAGGLSRAVGW